MTSDHLRYELASATLDNGLSVVVSPDSGAPGVAVNLWVEVGSADEVAGRTGFAHLFEHLMFKSTKHMPNEMFERLTEDIGGMNNAFTAPDTTAYYQVVPPNHVERILWAEAERLQHLQVDAANFASERSVVEEEYRERVLASPYGRLFNALPAVGYLEHPYRRPGIGSIEDLRAATLQDVQDFYRTYYRPDNAVLIVTGPTPPAQLAAWPDDDRRTRIVLIVRDVGREFFERTLISFNEGPGIPAEAGA